MIVPAKGFDKELQQYIVEAYTGHGYKEISDQLNPPAQVRSLEDHIHAEVKTNRKRDEEGHDKGRYVRLEGQHANVHYLLVQDEVVEHVVKENVEQRIATTAGSIMIGLNGHEPPEQGVEYVQHGKNGFSNAIVNSTHEVANLNQFSLFGSLEFVNRS